jgi:hypothetical protein
MAILTTRPLLVLACGVIAALGLGACGGGSGSFAGKPSVPSGYKTYSAGGLSFAYPGDWTVQQTTDPDGAPSVQVVPPDQSRTPYGLVQLSVTPKAADRFDSLADQRRIVIKTVNGGKIESDGPVDIPGAQKALMARTATPPRRGTDPVEVKSASLDVLRDDGDVVVLTAAAPQRGGGGLDPQAVISSFRLAG